MKTAKYLCIILLMAFGLMVGHIAFDGFINHQEAGDIGVVLGNKVEDNGKPSTRLARRLDSAIQLFNENKIKVIFVSGGIDPRGNDEAVTMKEYLVLNSIPEANVIVDSLGVDTYATAVNTKNYLDGSSYENVVVISHFYHITRTKMMMRDFGINVAGEKKAVYEFDLRDFYSLVREVAAIAKYSVSKIF